MEDEISLEKIEAMIQECKRWHGLFAPLQEYLENVKEKLTNANTLN